LSSRSTQSSWLASTTQQPSLALRMRQSARAHNTLLRLKEETLSSPTSRPFVMSPLSMGAVAAVASPQFPQSPTVRPLSPIRALQSPSTTHTLRSVTVFHAPMPQLFSPDVSSLSASLPSDSTSGAASSLDSRLPTLAVPTPPSQPPVIPKLTLSKLTPLEAESITSDRFSSPKALLSPKPSSAQAALELRTANLALAAARLTKHLNIRPRDRSDAVLQHTDAVMQHVEELQCQTVAAVQNLQRVATGGAATASGASSSSAAPLGSPTGVKRSESFARVQRARTTRTLVLPANNVLYRGPTQTALTQSPSDIELMPVLPVAVCDMRL
jgi:hypothetical protein